MSPSAPHPTHIDMPTLNGDPPPAEEDAPDAMDGVLADGDGPDGGAGGVGRRPSSASGVKPRGILKNAKGTPEVSDAPARQQVGEHLTWDEQNLALTEIQKDSLMKIDEPKTPYVRYDKNELDMDLSDVPDFELSSPSGSGARGREENGFASPRTSRSNSRTSTDPAVVAENTAKNAGPPRPAGFPYNAPGLEDSALESPSTPAGTDPMEGHMYQRQRTPSSGPTSRSTSFSLPEREAGRVRDGLAGGIVTPGEEVEEDTDDEAGMDEEARKAHQEFKQRRKGHYSNEAEAMRLAQELLKQEEISDDTDEAGEGPEA